MNNDEEIGMKEVLDALQKANPNRNVKDEIVGDILNGRLKLTKYDPQPFYVWCKNHIDEIKDASHPLNWINLVKYGIKELKNSLNLKPMIEVISKELINHKYKFTIDPDFLTSHQLKKIVQDSLIYLTLKGTLKFDKKINYFYLLTDEKEKIMGKFCWIIEEIKND